MPSTPRAIDAENAGVDALSPRISPIGKPNVTPIITMSRDGSFKCSSRRLAAPTDKALCSRLTRLGGALVALAGFSRGQQQPGGLARLRVPSYAEGMKTQTSFRRLILRAVLRKLSPTVVRVRASRRTVASFDNLSVPYHHIRYHTRVPWLPTILTNSFEQRACCFVGASLTETHAV